MNLLIQEASLTGVFRLLLVVLLIYFVFSYIMRYIVPAVMRKYVNDFQKKFNQQNQEMQDEQARKKEGEISIKFVDKDKNEKHDPDDGDYVDYEEIK